MKISILKYLNLFNVDPFVTNAIDDLPMHPPAILDPNGNPSASNLPVTQGPAKSNLPDKNSFVKLQKLIMLFDSISFNRTMVTPLMFI